MSVINEMLKDLDQRHYSEDQPQVSANYSDLKSVDSTTRPPVWWLLPGLLVIGLTVWLGWSRLVQTEELASVVREQTESSVKLETVSHEQTESLDGSDVPLPAYDLAQSVVIEPELPQPTQPIEVSTPPVSVQARTAKQESEMVAREASALHTEPSWAELRPTAIAKVENQAVTMRVETPLPEVSPAPIVKRSRHKYQLARDALSKNDYSRAERLLKEVLASEPDHLESSQLLARLYLGANRTDQAEKVILSALQSHPDQPGLVTLFSRTLLAQERLQEAVSYLSKAMQEGNAEQLGLLAAMRQREGRHAQASDLYRQALALKPDEITWLAGLGISLEHLGELGAAQQAYRRSLASGDLNITLKGFVKGRLQQLQDNN